ncbi:MAG: hypothetical protein ACI8RP_000489 [Urechidicola sp.]|jgi:hypothetical protein
MMKLYTEKSSFEKQPKQETIQFLLDYSKAMLVIKTESNNYIELHLN